eukprot:COSAG06_NODE_5912_length_3215_cov_3.685815_3_plen_71_part_00
MILVGYNDGIEHVASLAGAKQRSTWQCREHEALGRRRALAVLGALDAVQGSRIDLAELVFHVYDEPRGAQ